MKELLKSPEYSIVLRSIENKDAEFLMELNNDIEISHLVVGNPRTVNIQEQMQWLDNLKFETNCERFIVEHDGLSVGTVIISDIDNANLTASIGIKLHKMAWRKGIGKQSINLIIRYCFDDLNLACLTTHILTYNTASLALFHSCGFKNEGILRSRVIKENKRCDLVSLSLTRSEYNQN